MWLPLRALPLLALFVAELLWSDLFLFEGGVIGTNEEFSRPVNMENLSASKSSMRSVAGEMRIKKLVAVGAVIAVILSNSVITPNIMIFVWCSCWLCSNIKCLRSSF